MWINSNSKHVHSLATQLPATTMFQDYPKQARTSSTHSATFRSQAYNQLLGHNFEAIFMGFPRLLKSQSMAEQGKSSTSPPPIISLTCPRFSPHSQACSYVALSSLCIEVATHCLHGTDLAHTKSCNQNVGCLSILKGCLQMQVAFWPD